MNRLRGWDAPMMIVMQWRDWRGSRCAGMRPLLLGQVMFVSL